MEYMEIKIYHRNKIKPRRHAFGVTPRLICAILFFNNVEFNEYGIVVRALISGAYVKARYKEVFLGNKAEVNDGSAREGH